MSRQYQDPHNQPPSGFYQPSSSPPRQVEQPSQFYTSTQDTRMSQHAYPASAYSDGRQQPQTSTHSGGYPAYAEGHTTSSITSIPFPEPYTDSSSRQRSSTGQAAAYAAPSTLPQSTVGTYHQDRPEPYGYHQSGGFSSSQRTHPASGSVASSADVYARSEALNVGSGHYAGSNTQPGSQDWNDAEDDEGHHGPDFRQKGPHSSPLGIHRPKCRYPSCHNDLLFDRRINELREWCSEDHMRAAIRDGVEKACRQCGVWPRRYGFKLCSGNICRYQPPPPAQPQHAYPYHPHQYRS